MDVIPPYKHSFHNDNALWYEKMTLFAKKCSHSEHFFFPSGLIQFCSVDADKMDFQPLMSC